MYEYFPQNSFTVHWPPAVCRTAVTCLPPTYLWNHTFSASDGTLLMRHVYYSSLGHLEESPSTPLITILSLLSNLLPSEPPSPSHSPDPRIRSSYLPPNALGITLFPETPHPRSRSHPTRHSVLSKNAGCRRRRIRKATSNTNTKTWGKGHAWGCLATYIGSHG